MCGISAVLSCGKPFGAGLVVDALKPVAHRGPDDEGYLFCARDGSEPIACGGDDTPPAAYNCDLPYKACTHHASVTRGDIAVALGHRRLSIIDLSVTGHQPMCTPDRQQWIVYNGEIYNHVELRAELAALGHSFISRSDTEVILAAYRQWGKHCLAHLNGMFAFILLDRGAQRIFAARDRFGVKPLYYWISPDKIVVFASEIKQFSVLPGWRPRLNGLRAYDFINWALLDHTDETLFEGVFQLRNGQALEIDLRSSSCFEPGQRLPAYSWYTPRPAVFSGTFENAASELRQSLYDSIGLRLRADVSVGSCLSGGLDSSSIVCVMNELLRHENAHARQKTFSACAEVKRFDEREFIDEIVRRTAVDAHYVYPQLPELFDQLDTITWHQDEPFGSSSIYAQWEVFKLAATNGVKVMLDGQGADELFAGYHTYFGPRFFSLFKAGHWAALWRDMLATREIHGYSLFWCLEQIFSTSLPEMLRQPLAELAGKPALSPPWLDLSLIGVAPVNPFVAVSEGRPATIRNLSQSQLTHTNLQMLLHCEDRNSMAHSIEARVPFLDYQMVQYALGLPDDFKLSAGMTKRVLREAMAGLIPERVRRRTDKIGFATPEEVWLRSENPELFRKALSHAIESSFGIINREALGYLDAIIAGKSPFNFAIWRMISFGAWMRVFQVCPP